LVIIILKYIILHKEGGVNLIRRWFTRKHKSLQPVLEAQSIETAAGLCTKAAENPDPVREISHFKSRLKDFGIEFSQLAASTPKEPVNRLQAIQVAEEIAGDPEMRNYFLTWKRLPLLHDEKSQRQKLTMKRQREYITALTLIFIENYQVLMQYVPGTGGKHL
jgi:RNA polymerase sigma factor